MLFDVYILMFLKHFQNIFLNAVRVFNALCNNGFSISFNSQKKLNIQQDKKFIQVIHSLSTNLFLLYSFILIIQKKTNFII